MKIDTGFQRILFIPVQQNKQKGREGIQKKNVFKLYIPLKNRVELR